MTDIHEAVTLVEPFVRDYLGRTLLAKGRALFDWLNDLPQDEREEAVECICSFGAASLDALRGTLSTRPHLMYEAMERSPTLGQLVDECAVAATRTLTREDVAIFGCCVDIIQQAAGVGASTPAGEIRATLQRLNEVDTWSTE